MSISEGLLRPGLNRYLTLCHDDCLGGVLPITVIMSLPSCCPAEQHVASSTENRVFGFVYLALVQPQSLSLDIVRQGRHLSILFHSWKHGFCNSLLHASGLLLEATWRSPYRLLALRSCEFPTLLCYVGSPSSACQSSLMLGFIGLVQGSALSSHS